MILIRTSWYLCILLLFAISIEALISVAPEGESFFKLMFIITLSLFIIFLTASVILSRLYKAKPNSKLFESKFISRSFISLAVVLTLIIIGMI